ncbi:GlxA family transcriptional regulator [Aquimarina sp. M1]
MKKISIYVPKNAVIEGITPPYRLFTTANQFLKSVGKEPFFDVEYVGLEKTIPANDGEYSIKINRLISDVQQTDLVIIPPLYGQLQDAVSANDMAIPWLREMYQNSAELASLCVGAFLLGATGLIDGKKCSTHWAYCDEFKETFPNVEIVDGSVITDEGNIYSSGGANSLWNLLLYLLEKYTDRDTAILASKYFAIDIDRNSQSDFAIFVGQKNHSDIEIKAIQDYIEENYHEKMTIKELAKKCGASRRTFERRFKKATNNTVIQYIQRVKIEVAKRSFEKSRKNVTEVMFDIGYTDTKAFRDLFKKITGLTPIEYRNKYNKQS